MNPFSRRGLIGVISALGAVTAARASSFGNPDSPPEGDVNSTAKALSNPGPRNPALEGQFPSLSSPPPTDVEGEPLFWSSFNIVHKRVQSGGWARQVTQHEFEASKAIAGVNMRLAAGGIRELHWHQQAEWAIVTNGTTRITILDEMGRPQVADVGVGGLWYFPAGLPHSLQGMGPDGSEFILAFDNGTSSENNTLLLTDWLAHTPPDVLAKNFGVSADALKNIPLTNRWIFQGEVPGPLAADQASAQGTAARPPQSFVFDLAGMAPTSRTRSGTVQIADSTNFPVSKTIAAALVTVRPGGLREMHWHPNADEWQYYVKGRARMTVFDTGPKAVTNDFTPGDVGYIPKSLGHYVENTGSEDLVFLEIFRAERYQEVALTNWLAHTPPSLVSQTLNVENSVIKTFSGSRQDIVPL